MGICESAVDSGAESLEMYIDGSPLSSMMDFVTSIIALMRLFSASNRGFSKAECSKMVGTCLRIATDLASWLDE